MHNIYGKKDVPAVNPLRRTQGIGRDRPDTGERRERAAYARKVTDTYEHSVPEFYGYGNPEFELYLNQEFGEEYDFAYGDLLKTDVTGRFGARYDDVYTGDNTVRTGDQRLNVNTGDHTVRTGDQRLSWNSARDEIKARGLSVLEGGASKAPARGPNVAENTAGPISGDAYRIADPLSVVAVDENPSVLLTVASTLQPRGYGVRAFKSAYETLLALKDEPCRVLIVSLKMKHMSGSTLAEFALSARDASHVLLMADKWDKGINRIMRRERIDGFLIKPISKNELLDKLHVIMDS